jgi:hypothetical protein
MSKLICSLFFVKNIHSFQFQLQLKKGFCFSSRLYCCGDKNEILHLFNTHIKNKDISNIPKGQNEGNWLETQMGIKQNSLNAPDIYGYEMKKFSHKITLGDYSASEYIFNLNTPFLNEINEAISDDNDNNDNITIQPMKITRNEFIRFFGKSNPSKNGRYSWCGSCVPKYNEWNAFGQMLQIIEETQDICIYYSANKDKRKEITKEEQQIKANFPQKKPIAIAIWKKDKLKKNIENKFNQNGFFICKKKGEYFQEIMFGHPFNYDYFLEKIKTKQIVFESSMKEGCNRNYSFFRGSMKYFWSELLH